MRSRTSWFNTARRVGDAGSVFSFEPLEIRELLSTASGGILQVNASPTVTGAAGAAATLSPTIDFSSGFATSAGQVAVNGSANVNGSRLNLTNAAPLYQAGAAYFNAKQDVTAFTTTFTFQLSAASADGFCFVIQNAGPTALGGSGGSLGFAGISNSLAIKFDLYNNAGEGSDSTGLYVNGAPPLNAGSVDLTGSGIDLHSGHVFSVTLAYASSSLTQTITDTTTSAAFTKTYAVNVPAVVGGNTAYVGFTGGTGGLTATQDIATWTYTPTTVPSTPAPTGLTATAATASIGLSWNAVAGATSYNVYRSLTPGGEGSTPFATGLATPSYTDNAVIGGTTYYYQVAAVGSLGTSLPSVEASAVAAVTLPAAPSNLAATVNSSSQITLNWADNSSNETGFRLEQSTDGGTTWKEFATTGANVTTSVVNGLKAATQYAYRVRAYNAAGTSAYTNTATATTGGVATPINFAGGFTAASAISVNGSASLVGSRLNLTPATPLYQTGSAWATTKVDVTNFTTNFTFQLGSASADGFCFVIQNTGPSAVGASGGNLGYTGLANSVAIKFDLYNNAGEGGNSTGLYLNGAAPTNANAIDLTGSGIDLHSGHPFNVSLSYANGSLTQTITDTTTSATFTKSYAVNIPGALGANTAYVGFTGATGGLTAVQDVTAWTYSTPLPLVDTQPPTAPTNVGLSAATTTTATIQWAASTDDFGVTGYSIFRNGLSVGTTAGLTFTDTGLTASTGYSYTVVAFDAAGNKSPASTPLAVTTPAVPDTKPPTAPTNLALTSETSSTVTLTWTASTDNVAVTSYAVNRDGVKVATVTGATTYTDSGLSPVTAYAYTVTASDAAGNISAASNSLSVTTNPAPPPPPAPPGLPGTWNLSFNENFDKIDPAIWANRYWWNGNSGTEATFDPAQVSTSNGILSITAKQQNTVALNGVTNPYVSGLLSTGGVRSGQVAGFTFTYGYVESRSKIAPGQGMWSALWMLPADYNDNYELDVFENLGRTPNVDQGFLHFPSGAFTGFNIPGADLTQAYHTYGVDWEPDHVAWYLDGVEMFRYTNPSQIPNRPMYLILNLDAGGWAGPFDATSPAQSSWLVDYVRVWQH